MIKRISAFFLIGLASASMAFAAGGGTLRIAVDRNPRNLNPIFADDSASFEVISDLFDPLIRMNEKGEFEPVLASALPVISKDGKTISITLRKGILWHDGVELSTADVEFSLKLLQDKETNSPNLGYLDSVDSIEVVDRYTFIVHLSGADSQVIRDFAYEWIVPKHILGSMTKEQMEKGDFARMPVGNGQFKITENRTNERIVVVNNAKYFGKPAKLDGIVRLITPNGATALLKVETGEADMAFCNPADRERLSAKPTLNVAVYASTAFDCLQYNVESPFFSDKRVRQAVGSAINIKGVIQGIYKNGSIEAATSYPQGFWFSNPAVKPIGYDLARANRLLDEAGWKKAADGIRAKDGKRFEIDILTNQGDAQREKLVVYLQSALKAVGIAANPKILEWNTLFDSFIDAGKFDVYVGGYGGSRYPVQSYYKTGAYLNAGKYSSPALDGFMMDIRDTFDREEQRKAAFEIQKILVDEQPFTYVVFKTGSYVLSKKVKDAKFIPYGGPYDMPFWSVSK